MILEILTLDPLLLAIGASAVAGVIAVPFYIKKKKIKKKANSKFSTTYGEELVQPNDNEPQTYTINTVNDSTYHEHLDLNTEEINKPMRNVLEETLKKNNTIEKLSLALKYEQAKKHNIVEFILEHALKYELDEKEKTRLKVILKKISKRDVSLKILIKKYPSFLDQAKDLSSQSNTFKEVNLTTREKIPEDIEDYKKYDFSDIIIDSENSIDANNANKEKTVDVKDTHLQPNSAFSLIQNQDLTSNQSIVDEYQPHRFDKTKTVNQNNLEHEQTPCFDHTTQDTCTTPINKNLISNFSDFLSEEPMNHKVFNNLLYDDPLLNNVDTTNTTFDIENQLLQLKKDADKQDSIEDEEASKFFDAFQGIHDHNLTPTSEEENVMNQNEQCSVWANWMFTNNGKLSLKSSYFTIHSKWGTKSSIEELKALIIDQNKKDGAINSNTWVLLSIMELKN